MYLIPSRRSTEDMLYRYAVAIHEEDGDFVVSVRDIPEVVTSGDTLEEALELAADAIEVALAGRMEDEDDLPLPTPPRDGEHVVPVPPQIAAKAAVYMAWKRSNLSKSDLARRMGRSETEARRILKPRYPTKLAQLEEAARALDMRLVIGFEPEPG